MPYQQRIIQAIVGLDSVRARLLAGSVFVIEHVPNGYSAQRSTSKVQFQTELDTGYRWAIWVLSCTLAAVVVRLCTMSPLGPDVSLHPESQSFPFLVRCILDSASRSGAAMIVASTIVPDFSSSLREATLIPG